MAVNTKFEAYKLARELRRNGIVATVSRAVKNEFGEPGDIPLIIGTFPCLYHTEKVYVSSNTSDASMHRSTVNKAVGTPALLCLMDSVVGLDLEVNDIISLSSNSDNTYEVVEVNDIQNWGIIADVSLREVDDGDVQL